ncbi:MAG: hypothetical protein NZ893_00180 [Candidatus Aenigmarchaeota archaeon]|nr:hypothetical protein [Candidatus Aenigmarchaeota archaeon]
MCADINVAILGKPSERESYYLKHLLKMPNISLKYISSLLEAKSFPALILLEKPPTDLLIRLLEDNDIKVLIETPFAEFFEKEIELLNEIKRLNAEVFIPLVSRHHPILVRFRALLNRKMLGDVFSIYMTLNFDVNHLRQEPPLETSSITLSSRVLHQLINIIDYLLWLNKGDISQINIWVNSRSKEKEVLVVDAKLHNTLLTLVSYVDEVSPSFCKDYINIEAVGFERILVWNGFEQSLILKGKSDFASDHIYWGLDLGEVIARHFINIIKSKPQYDLKEVFISYEKTLKYLKSGKLRKRIG